MPAPARSRPPLQRRDGIGEFGGLVAEHQQPLAVAAGEIAVQRHRLGDRGEAEDAALLGGLDDIGAHPLGVDPGDLGEAGQHRPQRRGTHLDRLLHHVVEPGVLQRRKDVSEVGQPILRPGLGDSISRPSGRLRPTIAARHSPSRPLNTSTRLAGAKAAAHCRDNCSGSRSARTVAHRASAASTNSRGLRKSS